MLVHGTAFFFVQTLLLTLLLWLPFHCPARTISLRDTTPVEYLGYRLQVRHLEWLKQHPRKAVFRFQLINTGKETILPETDGALVQLLFDQSDAFSDSEAIIPDFRKALFAQNRSMAPGQIREITLKVPLSKTYPGQEEKVTHQKRPSSDFVPIASDATPLPPLDDRYCADLLIYRARVIESSRKWILVEYTMMNQGNAPVVIAGPQKGDTDNIAVKAYFSGTGKLTKGAVTAGGAFVRDLPQSKTLILPPGESHTAAFQLDLALKSKYTSNVILYADHYQLVRECDETNNAFAFLLTN